MPRDRYELIKLTQTTRYAGYQFHARVHVSGMQGLNRSFVLPSYVENGEWRRSPVSNILLWQINVDKVSYVCYN